MLNVHREIYSSWKSENKSFKTFVMRKSKEVTVVYMATLSNARHSSPVSKRGIKKKRKNIKNKKAGTVSFFITLHPFLFISYVNLKDSSIANVCKILPPIIVAQCYWLLKMVWCIYFKMRKKNNIKLEKRHIVYSLRYKSSVIASTKLCSCARP